MSEARPRAELGDYASTGSLIVREDVSGAGVAAVFVTGNPSGAVIGVRGQLAIDRLTMLVYQNSDNAYGWSLLVPAASGSTDTFLRGDSTYATPSGTLSTGLGYDGDLVFDGVNPVVTLQGTYTPASGVYTITSMIQARTIFVAGGVTVVLVGVPVYSRGAITGSGTFDRSGNPGAGINGGAALAAGWFPGGTAGGASGINNASTGTAGTTSTAAAGVCSTVNTPATSGGSSIFSPPSVTPAGVAAIGGRCHGGSGGGGGGSNAAGNGGGGGLGGPITLSPQPWEYLNPQHFTTGRTYNGTAYTGSSGGGGGGASPASSGGGRGGGGGSGAGWCFLCAYSIAATITIRADGGAGAAGVAIASGGGGGGGGGIITVVVMRGPLPLLSAAAGAGGLKNPTIFPGVFPNFVGSDGGAGGPGHVISCILQP